MKKRWKKCFNKMVSLVLVFLLIFNGNFIPGYSAVSESSLYKDGVRLQEGDQVSVTDELSWQVTIDQEELEEGVKVTLPHGVIPSIEGGEIDGIDAKVKGQVVTFYLPEESDLSETVAKTEDNVIFIHSDNNIVNLEEENSASLESETDDSDDVKLEDAESEQSESEQESESIEESETIEESESTEESESIEETESTNESESAEESESTKEPESIEASESVEETVSIEESESANEIDSVDSSDVTSTETSSLEEEAQTVDIPCTIDPEKVNNGIIVIAGMMLRISDIQEEVKSVSPDLVDLRHTDLSGQGIEPPVKDDDTISLSDKLAIHLAWDNLNDVNPGDYFEYDLPEAFGVPGESGSIDIYSDVSDPDFPSNMPFANLSWEKDSNILKVVFLSMGDYNGEEALSLLEDVYVEYQCTLDNNLQGDDQGRVEIALGESSVSVTVSELKPSPPKLQKEVGQLDSNGEVTWTITYTHPTDAYAGDKPDEIYDVLPQGLTYVEGSATATLDDGTDKTSEVTFDSENNTLTCSLNEIKAGQILTFSYKTRITELELQTIWENPTRQFSYENKAYANNQGESVDVDGDGKAVLTTRGEDWLGGTLVQKVGTVLSTDSDDYQIGWTVTIHTASRNFKTFLLTDTMGKGLLLVADSIQVQTEDGELTVNPQVTTDEDGKTIMNISLIDDEDQQQAAETYEITYTTKVKPEYFTQTEDLTDDDIKNKAELSYDWPDGVGFGSDSHFEISAITNAPNQINNSMMNKTEGSYNSEDHSLTWTIEVNPNHVNLTEALLVDDLSDSNPAHQFVPQGSNEDDTKSIIKKAVEDALPEDSSLEAITLENNKLTLEIKDIGKRDFSFSFKTYVSNSEYWAGNKSDTFVNTAIMPKEGTFVDDVSVSKDISSTARIYASNEVLKKESVSFNPNTKKMTWRLTVNKNATALGDVTIKDTLGSYLSCDPVDAQLDSEAFSSPNTFTVNGSIIEIDLSNVTQKRVITYTTTVDVDGADFIQKSLVELSNSAKMISTSNQSVVSNSVNVNLSNKVLTKNEPTREGLVAHYTVELNPLGLDLLKGLSDHKLQLEDTLPDGLFIDVESVKLYEASADDVTPSGDVYSVNLTKGAEISPVTTSYDSTERKLTVDVPDASGRYILCYDTYIVRLGVELKNDIQLVGSILGESEGLIKSSRAMTVASAGGARLGLPKDKFVSVQIKKTDESGTILKGAEFGLYKNMTDETPLVTGTCDDSTGICTLGLSKSSVSGIDYLYWKELTAPSGYALSSEWHTLKLSEYDSDSVLTAINVKDTEKDSGQIIIRKLDDQNNPLVGAEFGVYTDEACNNPVIIDAEVLTGISDNEGAVNFKGLYPKQTYYIKEIKAPAGYVESDRVIPVAAEKTWADPDLIKVVNEKANVTLEIQKVDSQDLQMGLSGAEFQLYEDTNCTIEAGAPQTTNTDGRAEFSGLLPHHTYYLKEMKAPANYNLKSDVITVFTEGNNQTLSTLKIENNLIGWDEKASIQIVKTSEDGAKQLEGAKFALYRKDQVTLVGEQITGAEGTSSFTDLSEGDYYLKEIEAPEGYQLSKDWIFVSVSQNAVKSVSVTNKVLSAPPASEEPSTPSNPGNTGSGESQSSSGGSESEGSQHSSGGSGGNTHTSGSANTDGTEKTIKVDESAASGESAIHETQISGEVKDQSIVLTANETPEHIKSSMIPKTGVVIYSGLWLAGAILSFVSAIFLCIYCGIRKRNTGGGNRRKRK